MGMSNPQLHTTDYKRIYTILFNFQKIKKKEKIAAGSQGRLRETSGVPTTLGLFLLWVLVTQVHTTCDFLYIR